MHKNLTIYHQQYKLFGYFFVIVLVLQIETTERPVVIERMNTLDISEHALQLVRCFSMSFYSLCNKILTFLFDKKNNDKQNTHTHTHTKKTITFCELQYVL